MDRQQEDVIALQRPSQGDNDPSLLETEQDVGQQAQFQRETETKGKRATTLIGQAVLQLPIWGIPSTQQQPVKH
jgi:hypothetical protein